MKKFGKIITGLILILIGVILALKALDIIKFNVFFKGWWTLVIIIPSFFGLFNNQDKKGSIFGMILGVALLLAANKVLTFELIWKLTFPTIFIIWGVALLLEDVFHKEVNDKIQKLNKKLNSEEGVCVTFSGQNITVKDEFKGTTLNAIFGGIKLDLTNAEITTDVVINATSIFGGIDILVSPDVNVKVKSTSLFGGVENASKGEKGKTVYVNATCVFGGINIK